ncbi:PIN domain nuclease [Candidatus Desantisbacteria bacterium CG_4_8_14_3_um_filter_40_12]|uniref:PIN domain nuclease n=4 Tax=unclassified Candidatus Desantisiibacteriota TaxID=3106372 RepID=A0A2M7JDU3_9BACT|nr:MAG: PIN domain nuclease [Candidatus Desantisbacteria bacterium CG23_combo_of_CG06-09_8_20_14_all_40_23]PIX17571.1 MAG: PIN domain nuclease [Candidatus Desantisbacteria bacterium CG_4_8_14_3_um_filter_40_12]PIY20369.1 MAG: PIN domain nuclease [Candidatus Desantisbacteria bacterium CG_4_10_14_3_um_filter_40_18]
MNFMNDNWFIDTNILIYAYDKEAGSKHQIAKEIITQCWEQRIGVISVQVLCEFFVRVTRVSSIIIDVEEAESIVHNLIMNWRVIYPDSILVMEAIQGWRKHQFSFWDAFIWASAKKARTQRLYSEDFQHKQIVEGVQFVNPFIAGNEGIICG